MFIEAENMLMIIFLVQPYGLSWKISHILAFYNVQTVIIWLFSNIYYYSSFIFIHMGLHMGYHIMFSSVRDIWAWKFT